METVPEANFYIEMGAAILIVLICVATAFMAWCFTSFIHELLIAKRLHAKRGLVSRQMTDLFWLPKKSPVSKSKVKIYREVTRL